MSMVREEVRWLSDIEGELGSKGFFRLTLMWKDDDDEDVVRNLRDMNGVLQTMARYRSYDDVSIEFVPFDDPNHS